MAALHAGMSVNHCLRRCTDYEVEDVKAKSRSKTIRK